MASTSEELSSQAEQLQATMSYFHIKEGEQPVARSVSAGRAARPASAGGLAHGPASPANGKQRAVVLTGKGLAAAKTPVHAGNGKQSRPPRDGAVEEASDDEKPDT